MKSLKTGPEEPPQADARAAEKVSRRRENRFISAKIEKNPAEMCLFLKNILYLQSQSEGFCSFLPKESGRSSVRLEYTSGGRVVAGSNPVTPTDEKSLIFNRISRIFLLWYIVRKMAVVHKWYINGRYSKNFNLSR